MKLCDEINSLISITEEGFKLKGETSTDNEHNHSYSVDEDGNGDTDKINEHSHTIEDFQVKEYEDHTHDLESVEEGKASTDRALPTRKKQKKILQNRQVLIRKRLIKLSKQKKEEI